MDHSHDALQKTTRLIEFLAEVKAAVERDPVIDILEDPDPPDPIIWLDVLPDGTLQQALVTLSWDSVFPARPHTPRWMAPRIAYSRAARNRTSVRCRSLSSAAMSIRAPAVQKPTESLRGSGRRRFSRSRHPLGPVGMLATPHMHVNRLKRGDFQPT